MNDDRGQWKLRADLVCRKVRMGRESYWVIKDPLSQNFFYFDGREYSILKLLDGRRSLADIAHACERVFAPDYLATDALVGFIADARRKGLVLANNAPPIEPPPKRSWWKQPLAIRLPGINPDPLLETLLPPLRFLFTPAAALTSMVVVVSALLLVLTRWEIFADHVQIAAGRANSRSLLVLVALLSGTKIIHELAHGLACKRFGGQCREIGVMLLVGVPCLYCDVSDAWLLKQRWKRVAISLAGIAAELVIASIAAFVWIGTADGAVRDAAVYLMLICSVSTVLFNGNPLLKYDGYFVLSDVSGIPNLANESYGTIRNRIRELLWGTPTSVSQSETARRRLFYWCYGIASGLYRVFVLFAIGLMLYRFAKNFQLETVAGMLCVAAVIAILYRWLKPILQPPPTRWRGQRIGRPALAMSVFILIVGVVLLIPLPHRIVAPMSIRAANAQPVFVSLAGRLDQSVTAGGEVRKGDVIAELSNPELEAEIQEHQSELRTLDVQLTSLRRRRTNDREAAAQIPLVTESIAGVHARNRVTIDLAERLTLRATRDGRIFDAPMVPEPSADDSRSGRRWTGSPLDPTNRGAWLEEGTTLCLLGDANRREALVMIRQQDVTRIRPGQSVTLLLSDRQRGLVKGTVMEVASSPSKRIPDELSVTGWIDSGEPGEGVGDVYFQVRVEVEPTTTMLPIRTIGHARIDVGSASILGRATNWVRESFR